MKRSQLGNQAARRKKTTKGKSRYKAKVDAGEQMYGPGCCAHRLTAAQIEAHKAKTVPGDKR